MSGSAQSTVLVVEDEVLVRLDLVDNLEGEGYLTYEAGNAADAIAILEMHPEIRVVITDIQMPGDMDGLQLSSTDPLNLFVFVHLPHVSLTLSTRRFGHSAFRALMSGRVRRETGGFG